MKVLYSPKHALHVLDDVMALGGRRRSRDVPERVDVLLRALAEAGHRVDEADDHGMGPIAAVHTPEYLDFLARAYEEWRRLPGTSEQVFANVFPVRDRFAAYPTSIVGRAGYHMHDQLSPIGPHTFEAAVASANVAAHAAHRVLGGETVVYALCRPSGHHAYSDMGGGATYLNNAAIAAQYLLRGCRRVALIDIDVHHGNGTQGIFYDRADVLFVSLHRDPCDFHPYYAGHAHERRQGAGLGCTLNVPLPAGTQDNAYLDALEGACRRIQAYAPDALVVSLGLDAHERDPSEGLGLTSGAYERIGARLGALHRPSVLVQEGGYGLDVIGPSLVAFLTGFTAVHGPS